MNHDEGPIPANGVPDQPKARLALGIVTHQFAGATAWWLGAAEEARQQDVDLFVFDVGSAWEVQTPAMLNHLVGPERLDGLVAIQWWPTSQIFEEIYTQYYSPLPIVNVHRHYAGYPGVAVDSYQGMLTQIRHLIEVHGYHRLAFIRGEVGNPAADARYEAYVAALAEYDLPLNETLLVPGGFSWEDGTNAVHALIDERGLRPIVDFEAIVASNDNAALAAMDELRRRGFRVPLDVAVVGFDNTDESAFSLPPLTTVQMPTAEMSRLAIETVLSIIRSEPYTEYMTVAGQLVVRQSCGCFSSPLAGVEQAAPSPVAHPPATPPAEMRAQAMTELLEGVGSAGEVLAAGWAEQLVDTFTADVERVSDAPGHFLGLLYEILRQLHIKGYDPLTLGRMMLLTLRRCMRPTVSNLQWMQRAEGLWQQAMAFVPDIVHHMQAARRYYGARYTEQLRLIGEQLITTFDMTDLLALLARELPSLNIPSAYIALYPEPIQQPALQVVNAQLVLAYNADGRDPFGVEGQIFPVRQLLPDGVLSPDRAAVMIVTPLYFQETALGFALFEVGPAQGDVYTTLARQISSALMGALLVQQQEEAQRDMDAARQRAQAALSDLLTTRSISDRVRQAADTEAILRVTLEALSQALGASTAVARLGTREQLLEIAGRARGDAGLN